MFSDEENHSILGKGFPDYLQIGLVEVSMFCKNAIWSGVHLIRGLLLRVHLLNYVIYVLFPLRSFPSIELLRI